MTKCAIFSSSDRSMSGEGSGKYFQSTVNSKQ